IRDFHVTGVQTCALPIWSSRDRPCGRVRSSLRSLRCSCRTRRPPPLFGESECGRAALAAAGTCDQSDLALEPSHESLPFQAKNLTARTCIPSEEEEARRGVIDFRFSSLL